jgi:uncharacterized protein (TIGR03083 family)
MADPVDAYIDIQQRLIDAISDPAADVGAPVPSCPGWNVRDVVAHHVGVVVDVARGSLGDIAMDLLDQWRDLDVQRARDTMTARQVDERRDHSVQELTDEWREATKAVAPMMRGEVAPPPSLPPYVGFILVNDLVVHETDIRSALSLARAPASPALSLALAGYSFSLDNRIRQLGTPSLVLAYDGKQRQLDKQRQLEEQMVGATVSADRHELVGVLAGRRTRDQILGLDWEGDPSPFLDILLEYGPVTQSTTD